MEFEFKFDDQQLLKNFKQLSEEVAAKQMISAAKAAVNLVVKDAKTRINSESGLLARSLQIDVKSYKKGEILYVIAGINKKVKGEYNGESRIPKFYAAIVELRKPFLRPAFEANKNKIQAKFIKDFERKLNNQIKKLKK